MGIKANKKYGKWTTLFPLFGLKYQKWMCQCECGTIRDVHATGLYGGSMSCGCIQKKSYPEVRLNTIYFYYKRRAKKNQMVFWLSKEEFQTLIDGSCIYCGDIYTSYIGKNGQTSTRFYYTGIDRVDSKQGYVIENCVSCCKICNRAKSDMDVNEFLDHFNCKFGVMNEKRIRYKMLDVVE